MQPQTIGYWRAAPDETGTDLPWPIENSVEDAIQQTVVIAKFQKLLASSKLVRYRGSSRCRLCGIANGSAEFCSIYEGVTYRIPEGYLHYLTVHNVKADSRLLNLGPCT